MDRGKLIIEHIPLNVFYDDTIRTNRYKLPSEERNIDIITGIKFGMFLSYIQNNNESNIKTWFNEYEKKLKNHLRKMQKKLEPHKREKYCTNLNYILDFVVQAIDNLHDIQYASLTHQFQTKSRDILKEFSRLGCIRNYANFENKHLYIKKIMYDLYEDIQYMSLVGQNIRHDQCSNMVNRIKNRWKILIAIHEKYSDKKNFNFEDEYTIPNINEMLETLKCIKTPEHPKSVSATESQPLVALQRTGNDLSDSRASKEGEAIVDLKNPDTVSTEDELEIDELEPTEEDHPSEPEPNLKTTYAAASLAGISLFGTILYKYGPSGSLLNPRRGARIRGNVFPLGNNVYDASIMNNFEYLQTGIPNGEYQLGYGSVTDY
ncbi:PIR protein [Plasmodium vivax]|uniref:VIR protein n=1 Tax=Plasmodium vivax TaxID=5855 RepID=A0A565A5T1_PLAVI|nr:PIR protein [Plasmodium vivax]